MAGADEPANREAFVRTARFSLEYPRDRLPPHGRSRGVAESPNKAVIATPQPVAACTNTPALRVLPNIARLSTTLRVKGWPALGWVSSDFPARNRLASDGEWPGGHALNPVSPRHDCPSCAAGTLQLGEAA